MEPSISHVVHQDTEIALSICRKCKETGNIVDFRKSLTRKEWGEYLKYLLSRFDNNRKKSICAIPFENDFPITLPFSNTKNQYWFGCELLPTFSYGDDPKSTGPEEREVISATLYDLVSTYLETSPDLVDSLISNMRELVYVPTDHAGSAEYLAPFDYNSLKTVCDSPTTKLITKFLALCQFWAIPDSERRSKTEEVHELLLKYREAFSSEHVLLHGIIYALVDFGYLEDAIDTMKLVSVWPEACRFDKTLYSAVLKQDLKDVLLSKLNDDPASFPEPIAWKLRNLIENGPK
ncbi:MAG: hypothetical protein HGB18_05285 [Candidatus Moranbacteria bacterium]|nr:hypothetical protein [Candidatus Moranbacteria bacterium]